MSETTRAGDASAGAARQPVIESNPEEIGQILSLNYTILRQLVSSASSVTYLARSHRLEDSPFADISGAVLLKVFHSKDGNEQEEDLFCLEANSAARLCHRNILKNARADIATGGSFCVLENKEGCETLRRLITREAWLDTNFAIRIMGQIVSALDYADQNGVLHLNLQPESVLIDPEGAVIVSGFGIDSSEKANWAQKLRSSQINANYMSPEQALGEKVDHRSDLYSAGVLLYEMLTDRVPIIAGNAEAAKRKQIASAAQIGIFRPDLPELLANLVSSLLARDPENRIQSAAEAKAVLDQLSSSEPLAIPPDSISPVEVTEDELSQLQPVSEYEATGIERPLNALAVDEIDESYAARADQTETVVDEAVEEVEFPLNGDAELLNALGISEVDSDSEVVPAVGSSDLLAAGPDESSETGIAELPVVRAPFDPPDLRPILHQDTLTVPTQVIPRPRAENLSSALIRSVATRYSVFAASPTPRASRYVLPLAATVVVLVSIIAFADVDYLSTLFTGDSDSASSAEAAREDLRERQPPRDRSTPVPAPPQPFAAQSQSVVPDRDTGAGKAAARRGSPRRRLYGAPRPRGSRKRLSGPNPYRWLDDTNPDSGWTRYRRSP